MPAKAREFEGMFDSRMLVSGEESVPAGTYRLDDCSLNAIVHVAGLINCRRMRERGLLVVGFVCLSVRGKKASTFGFASHL